MIRIVTRYFKFKKLKEYVRFRISFTHRGVAKECEEDGNPVILFVSVTNFIKCNLRISWSADG